jgi:hypothetical protein
LRKLLPKVKTERGGLCSVKADTKNVIYTGLGLAIAVLPTPTVAKTAVVAV